MKIFSHKKSQEILSNWPFWIFFLIAIGMVSLVIVKVANVSVDEASKIPKDIEDKINLISRFYSSEDCFAYKDDTGRVHMRVIDASEFGNVNMEKCFPRSNVDYAFSFSLSYPDPVITSLNQVKLGPSHTSNWVGGYATEEVIENVIVLTDDDTKYPGKLIIGIKNV